MRILEGSSRVFSSSALLRVITLMCPGSKALPLGILWWGTTCCMGAKNVVMISQCSYLRSSLMQRLKESFKFMPGPDA